MTETVEDFVCENGFEEVFDALKEFKDNDESFHAFAEEHDDVEMQDWFEFGWLVNKKLGGLREDVIPLVEFNYVDIEAAAVSVVDAEAPIEFSELVEAVSDETGESVSDVSEWLGFVGVFEENEEREIVEMELRD